MEMYTKDNLIKPFVRLPLIAPLIILIPLAGYGNTYVDNNTLFPFDDTPIPIFLIRLCPTLFLVYLARKIHLKVGNSYSRNIFLAMISLCLGELFMFHKLGITTGICGIFPTLYHAILIYSAGFEPSKTIFSLLYTHFILFMYHISWDIYAEHGMLWLGVIVVYYFIMVTFTACAISRIKTAETLWINTSRYFLVLGAICIFCGDTYYLTALKYKDLPNNMVISTAMVHLSAGAFCLSAFGSEDDTKKK